MLLLRCPKCGQTQKYQPVGGYITEKRKTCVYCGKSFKVHTNQAKTTILKKLR